ncbi:MAG: phosphate-starvation-inducible PsiE family protein [Aquificaceae bacterium]|nr:phosphate-starvation-inducible PsiE family protein [Aquificaceae bacterium]
MKDFEELKNLYRWNFEDEKNAKKLKDMALRHMEDLVLNLPYGFPDRERARLWLEGLFELKCTENMGYGDPLTLSLIRQFLQDRMAQEVTSIQERHSLLTSLNKVLDLCLLSTLPEGKVVGGFSPLSRYQRWMIRSIRRVSRVFDVFILLTLLLVGFSIVVWIVYEFYLVLVGKLPLERGGLSILGSILILYAISELLLEQIKTTKGGAVSIKTFLGVALAAVIRKVLILSLSPEKFYELLTLSLILLSLGLVFLLVHKVESST